MNPKGLRTWVEVSMPALTHNYKVFRRHIPKGCKLMAVTKSNAYGHYLVDFSKTMARLGVDWLGVDSIVEARTLRRSGVKKPMLVLGSTLPENLREAISLDTAVTISTFEGLKAVSRLRGTKPLRTHIKVDTGMHRQGFSAQEMTRVTKMITRLNTRFNTRLFFEGLYTHFAAAKNPAFPKDTDNQIRLFNNSIRIVHSYGFRPICHAAATSGALLFPKSHFDMVRIGIGLYGLWPSREAQSFYEDRILLRPALSWKAVVGEVKKLKKGDRIGYDLTEALPSGGKVAVIPVGYWHGYPRSLSSIGHMVIRGKRAKVLGRISMDMTVVDISHIRGVRPGDIATLVGKGVTVDELAKLSGTINYEVVTQINPLIKRIYV